jgi:hypothetical protein
MAAEVFPRDDCRRQAAEEYEACDCAPESLAFELMLTRRIELAAAVRATGTNGENRIEARGAGQDEAWHKAVLQAEAAGMAGQS